MTVAEIKELVPALSEKCIRSHLMAGRSTRMEMLTYDVNLVRKRSGRLAAKRKRISMGLTEQT